MRHRASPKFWSHYAALPIEIQGLADRSFATLRTNEGHPSLSLKRIGRLLSVRVGLHYRALAIIQDDGAIWFWIGHHAEYDRMLRAR